MLVPGAENVTGKLAYYKAASGPGVLGPRGWHCFGLYGSGSEALFVTPAPIDKEILAKGGWEEPAIVAEYSYGDTSGRFEVAKVIARVFPAYRAFVKSIEKEFDVPPRDFPLGPYPADKLVYRSKSMVEYETPARAAGLGTFWLKQGDRPIAGVAVLVGATPNLILLSVRLPRDLADVTAAIIRQVEHDASLLAN